MAEVEQLEQQRKTVTVDGIETSYIDVGSGPAILLVHGGEPGGSSGSLAWSHNIRALAEHHRVVAIDRVGQGRSGNLAQDAPFRIARIAEHTAATAESLGVNRYTAVGQSRGAFVVSYLAYRYAARVERLVLINSASFAPARAARHEAYLANVQGTPASVLPDNKWLRVKHDTLADDWVAAVSAQLDSDLRREAQKRFKLDAEDYYADFDAVKRETLKWYEAGNFNRPGLVIWGVGDPMTSDVDGLEVFRLVSKASPHARMHMLGACGHLPFAEYPVEFNELLSRFVATT